MDTPYTLVPTFIGETIVYNGVRWTADPFGTWESPGMGVIVPGTQPATTTPPPVTAPVTPPATTTPTPISALRHATGHDNAHTRYRAGHSTGHDYATGSFAVAGPPSLPQRPRR